MKRIGIIGLGGIANGTHITQLLDIKECRITAICDINPEVLEKTALRPGLENAHKFTDYRELIDCDDVDAVEICTPNHVHVEITEYAISKGKPINSEKPLSIGVEECERLEKTLKEKNILNMMCFSYRFMPAVRYAKWIIDNNLIGDIVGVNVEYLKSSALWEGRRLEWRFVKKYAGTGVLGDLGVHLIDMAQLLVGDFTAVSGALGIVVKQRMRLDCDELADVETDDYCNFIANLKDRRTSNNVAASFAVTRCAIGHQNTIKYDIFGTKGVISFNLNNPEEIGICTEVEDVKTASVQTASVPQQFYIKQEQAFIDALHGKICDDFPTVSDGVKCQRILAAIIKSSETGGFVNI